MKWIVISALLLLFSTHTLSAQMSSKKVGIEFASTQSLNLKAVYSVNENKQPEVNYIITKSKFEIPINYESPQIPSSNPSLKHKLNSDSEHLNFHNQTVSNLQSFNIFTIIDLNNISIENHLDDINYLSPDLKKFLPEGFNPYSGMFQDDFNLNSLWNPITAR
ncbi:hypothetical protein BN863_28170 [Formosa agariphila KMM 3901]|uniref:Uncharacterized protein n=1 Tax=Formosa agariphila (strain DSM 15362 / KCTC 12365 / LMG 23005 / KMM 3901 / M-2Alg 35-1) TaxID=1347342 RepID=T2KR97_FORAG|nr:hypothetical protein [Formosa agariphila]CDF80529.1 hypothetical protein BN863_28170 [Formosa agariphila KMM 3901]